MSHCPPEGLHNNDEMYGSTCCECHSKGGGHSDRCSLGLIQKETLEILEQLKRRDEQVQQVQQQFGNRPHMQTQQQQVQQQPSHQAQAQTQYQHPHQPQADGQQ